MRIDKLNEKNDFNKFLQTVLYILKRGFDKMKNNGFITILILSFSVITSCAKLTHHDQVFEKYKHYIDNNRKILFNKQIKEFVGFYFFSFNDRYFF